MNNIVKKTYKAEDLVKEYTSLLKQSFEQTFNAIYLFNNHLQKIKIFDCNYDEISYSTKFINSIVGDKKILDLRIDCMPEIKITRSMLNTNSIMDLKKFDINHSNENVKYHVDLVGQIYENYDLHSLFLIEFKKRGTSRQRMIYDIFRIYVFVASLSEYNGVRNIFGSTIVFDDTLKQDIIGDSIFESLEQFKSAMNSNKENEFKSYLDRIIKSSKDYKVFTIYAECSQQINSYSIDSIEFRNIFSQFIISLTEDILETLDFFEFNEQEIEWIKNTTINKYPFNFFYFNNNFEKDYQKFKDDFAEIKNELFLFKSNNEQVISDEQKQRRIRLGNKLIYKIKVQIREINKNDKYFNDQILSKNIDQQLNMLILILESIVGVTHDNSEKIYFENFKDIILDKTTNEKNDTFFHINEVVRSNNFDDNKIHCIIEAISYWINLVDDENYKKNFTSINSKYKVMKKNKYKLINKLCGFILLILFDIDKHEESELELEKKLDIKGFTYILRHKNLKDQKIDENFSMEDVDNFNKIRNFFINKYRTENFKLIDHINLSSNLHIREEIFDNYLNTIKDFNKKIHDVINNGLLKAIFDTNLYESISSSDKNIIWSEQFDTLNKYNDSLFEIKKMVEEFFNKYFKKIMEIKA